MAAQTAKMQMPTSDRDPAGDLRATGSGGVPKASLADGSRSEPSIRKTADTGPSRDVDQSRPGDLVVATLDAIRHGIIMVNEAGEVLICNRQARVLLELPDDFAYRRVNFDELIGRLYRYPVEPGDNANTT